MKLVANFILAPPRLKRLWHLGDVHCFIGCYPHGFCPSTVLNERVKTEAMMVEMVLWPAVQGSPERGRSRFFARGTPFAVGRTSLECGAPSRAKRNPAGRCAGQPSWPVKKKSTFVISSFNPDIATRLGIYWTP